MITLSLADLIAAYVEEERFKAEQENRWKRLMNDKAQTWDDMLASMRKVFTDDEIRVLFLNLKEQGLVLVPAELSDDEIDHVRGGAEVGEPPWWPSETTNDRIREIWRDAIEWHAYLPPKGEFDE